MLYTHEISDPETFVRREARADVLMLSSCESILPRLALSQEQKRKIQTLEINVPPHSRREKPAPDGLPIKFRSINTKNQSDTFLIRNDPFDNYPFPYRLQSEIQTWNVFSIPKYWSKIANISTYPYET